MTSPTASPPKGMFAPIPGTLSLVLPAYNEEDNIEIVVRQALAVLPDFTVRFEIIVVNDGSKDATATIIDRLATGGWPGQAGSSWNTTRAMAAPSKSGFQASTCEYVMFMDADRQFDIADIRLLCPFVPLFDIVAGFRMERSDPIIRRINAEVFNLAVRILFDVHIRDLDCAFKIFRGDLIRSLELTSAGALLNAETHGETAAPGRNDGAGRRAALSACRRHGDRRQRQGHPPGNDRHGRSVAPDASLHPTVHGSCPTTLLPAWRCPVGIGTVIGMATIGRFLRKRR